MIRVRPCHSTETCRPSRLSFPPSLFPFRSAPFWCAPTTRGFVSCGFSWQGSSAVLSFRRFTDPGTASTAGVAREGERLIPRSPRAVEAAFEGFRRSHVGVSIRTIGGGLVGGRQIGDGGGGTRGRGRAGAVWGLRGTEAVRLFHWS